jgi:cytochrome c-type biogenesis protein CcmH
VTTFWVIAALLCAGAVAILVVPLWRQKRRVGAWSPMGLGVAIAIVPLSFAVYFQLRTWDPVIAERAAEGERLVAQLAARLERSPEDVEGWTLLARSYMALGQYDQGRAAYQQAFTRTPMPDDDLKLSFAEAQILTDRASLTGEAGRLVEEVLAGRPGDPRALWYGGLVALELGREDAVRTRWTALLQLGPPEEVATVVRTQLAALGVAPGNTPSGGAVASAAAGPTIQLDVSLGPGRSLEQLQPAAQLFIFARAPEGGPPLAVIRRPASAVPGQFTLSDANSMIQGRSLANYERITIVARLSASGQPTEQPGDWFAQTVVDPKQAATVALVIDQVVQ